ncbi:RidA family protein [Mucilaginibacter gynuensis]|uniref:RidA family protein n=1 Tax=Mucilaginibacter gynuensis TaxID=1302236 RepID=A0ABP8G610_9SPHI
MKTILIFLTMALKMTVQAQTPEDNLLKQGITLPELSKSLGNYVSLVRSGNLIFLAGRGPLKEDGSFVNGKLGKELNVRDGYAAARLCTIAQIAVLKAELGDLSKIRHIVKVTGFVSCVDTFTDHPKVVNGCSDLLVKVFGAKGIHSRSAVGVTSLPSGWPVEVEMIVEVMP